MREPNAAGQPLARQRCAPQSGAPLDAAALARLQAEVPQWLIDGSGAGATLSRCFQFADFHHTMAFVNAVAWIAHEQDHHPDMQVSYNRCTVRFSTHSVGGISVNDFICAAKLDAALV